MKNVLEYVESYLSSKDLRKTNFSPLKSQFFQSTTTQSQLIIKKIEGEVIDSKQTRVKGKVTSLENSFIQRNIDPNLSEKLNQQELKIQKLNYENKIKGNIIKLHQQELKQNNKVLLEMKKEKIDNFDVNSNRLLKSSKRLLEKNVSDSFDNLSMVESILFPEFIKITVGFNEKIQTSIEYLDISLSHVKETKYSKADSLVKILTIKLKNVSDLNLSVQQIIITPGKGRKFQYKYKIIIFLIKISI